MTEQLSDLNLGRKLWWTAHQMKSEYRNSGFLMARLFCLERGLDPDGLEADVVHGGWGP